MAWQSAAEPRVRQNASVGKVHRLSRKGVPDKRRGSTPTPEGVDDIVSASSKDEEWSNSDVLETCGAPATLREQNHGLEVILKLA